MSAPKDESKINAAAVIKCRVSVSHMPQNLSCGTRFLAYAHKNEAHLLPLKSATLGNEKADSVKCIYAGALCAITSHTRTTHNMNCNSNYTYFEQSLFLMDVYALFLCIECVLTLTLTLTEKDALTGIEFVTLSVLGSEVMIITTNGGGVFLYDASGQKLVGSYKSTGLFLFHHYRIAFASRSCVANSHTLCYI